MIYGVLMIGTTVIGPTLLGTLSTRSHATYLKLLCHQVLRRRRTPSTPSPSSYPRSGGHRDPKKTFAYGLQSPAWVASKLPRQRPSRRSSRVCCVLLLKARKLGERCENLALLEFLKTQKTTRMTTQKKGEPCFLEAPGKKRPPRCTTVFRSLPTASRSIASNS